jgi:hypothetical protein
LVETAVFSAVDQSKLSRLGLPDGTYLSGPIVSFHNISDRLDSASGEGMLSAVVAELKKVRPGGPNNDAAMIYLSAEGVLDSRGNACLVPSAITTGLGDDTESQLVRVDQLLKSLRAAVPERVALIVVLDCCRPGGWPLGIYDGAFACAVESALSTSGSARCWTILPCGPGQIAQQTPLANGSAFAHFFSAALQGAADASPHGNSDRIVDLAELMACLKDQIDRWAVATCGERQTPTIYPPLAAASQADKIELSRRGFFWSRDRFPIAQRIFDRLGAAPGQAPDTRQREGKEAWLLERWRVADSLRSAGVSCKPFVWQEYLQLLMRLERLDRAGGNAQEISRDSARVEQLENELDAVRFYGFEQLPSLRLATLGGRGSGLSNLVVDTAEWQNAMAKYVGTTPDPKGPPVVIPTAESAEVWMQRAITAWQWLTDRLASGLVVDHSAMSRWLEFLGPTPEEMAAEPLEIHVTRMMVRWVTPATWNSASPLFGKLLCLVGRSQQARYSTEVTVDACLEHMASRRAVDEKLREAIDLALVGSPESLMRAATLVDEVVTPLENAVMLSDEAAAAIQLNDTISDELPWLAAWHASERRAAAVRMAGVTTVPDGSPAEEIDLQTLAELLWRFRRTLSQTLRGFSASPELSPAKEIGQLRRSREELERYYTTLRIAYLNACDSLATSSADTPTAFASIQRVLAIPVVRGVTRGRLLQRARTLTDRFSQLAHYGDGYNNPLPSVEPMTAVAGWIRWRQMSVHPLLPFMIEDAQGAHALPSDCTELSQAVGSQIEQVMRVTTTLVAEAITPGGRGVIQAEPETTPAVPPAVINVEHSHGARRFAAVVGRSIESSPTSPSSIWHMAWRHRLLSAARHTLQDFWAGVEPDEPIWCAITARGYLRPVNKLGRIRGADPLIEETGAVVAAVENLEESAGAIVSLTNDPKAVIMGAAADALSGAANHTTVAPLLTDFPRGVGALWLAASASSQPYSVTHFKNESVPERVERMPVPIAAQRLPTVVSWTASNSPSNPGFDGTSQMLDMVFWFRGHRLIRGMPVSASEGLHTVEWNQVSPSQPRVAVHGDAVRNRSVAVVFDASGSMGQRLLDGRTRLESGREALYEVLDLMKQDGWNASLWVYGHRTRWSRDKEGRYSAGFTPLGTKERDAVLKTGKKFTLLPGDDVEQILDMQPLSPVEVLRIRSLLDGVEPGGETPLYLAINEALRGDFAFSEPGPGHVLVVTDGANEQSGGKMTSYSDVLRTLSRVNFKRISGHEVRIDVIGFNFVPGQFNREARLQELQSLAADSGGRFFDATDPMKLGTSLRQSLRMMRWRVEGTGAPRESATLGSALSLPNPINGQTDNYDVVLDAGPSSPRRRIGVSGGESLDLRVTGNGRGLDFQRYTGGTEQGIRDSYDDLPDPGDAKRRWFIAAHLARRELQTIRFPISIQNAKAADFSPRPIEMWAEIRPKLPDNTLASPYILWDISYQASRPVPVIDLVIPNWPSVAASAEISTWFRWTPTAPDMVLPLSDLVPGVDRVVDVTNMPHSRLRLFLSPSVEKDRIQLTVIEEHDANGVAEVPLLRVTVSPPCQRAIHSRHQNSIRVRHTFLIATVQGRLPPGAACTVTDSRRIREGAVGLRSQIGLPATLAVPVPTE